MATARPCLFPYRRRDGTSRLASSSCSCVFALCCLPRPVQGSRPPAPFKAPSTSASSQPSDIFLFATRAGGEITSTFDDPGSVKLGHCKVGEQKQPAVCGGAKKNPAIMGVTSVRWREAAGGWRCAEAGAADAGSAVQTPWHQAAVTCAAAQLRCWAARRPRFANLPYLAELPHVTFAAGD